MRALSLLPPLLLASGIALIVWSVLEGEAAVGLFLVFPFVIGSSGPFFLGVVCLVIGLFTLPLAWGSFEVEEAEGTAAVPATAAPTEAPSWGGLVVVGPVPVFFGKWRNASTLAWVLAIALGVSLLVTTVLVLLLVYR